jgi:hypothetical protein
MSERKERSVKMFEESGRETFHLIITRRGATEILFLQDGADLSLPTVDILPKQRIAPQLTAEVRSRWALDAYCLFLPAIESVSRNAREANFALLESVSHDDRALTGSCWMPSIEAVGNGGRGTEARAAIRESLEQLALYVNEPDRGPFARPGWLNELFEWTRAQIHPLGLQLTGTFRQFNASPTFSLLRLETGGPAVWFKATGKPNRHELAIFVCLAHLFPGHVTAIWGVHSSWNGWLAPEAPGRALEGSSDLSAWVKVAQELAQLEIASIGKDDELLEARCKDLRIRKLVGEIDPFLARMGELMAAQEKQSPGALRNSELALVGSSLEEACSGLADLGMPDTLGHLGFNPGNIFISRDRCVFLDWADGVVTNPLVTCEYLLEHFRRSRPNDRAGMARIRTAYLRPWQAFLSPAELEDAMAFSSLIAVFAYALQANVWRSAGAPNLMRARYLRSLTRRMFREASERTRRSHRCLA